MEIAGKMNLVNDIAFTRNNFDERFFFRLRRYHISLCIIFVYCSTVSICFFLLLIKNILIAFY